MRVVFQVEFSTHFEKWKDDPEVTKYTFPFAKNLGEPDLDVDRGVVAQCKTPSSERLCMKWLE
jgi:hypothetical protein